jgi:hypothetical protein
MSNADKVAEACRNAAAMMNPDLYWWDQFWNAMGAGGVILIGLLIVGGFVYTMVTR